MKFEEAWKKILEEISGTMSQVDATQVEKLVDMIQGSQRVFVLGAGRSGLMMRTFAMRLMQMGFETYVAGETTTPNVSKGDLLIVGSGSGETGGPVGMAQVAKRPGLTMVAITIFPQSSLGKLADFVVRVPAPTPKTNHDGGMKSVQPMGSLFEQGLLLMLDSVILLLMERLRMTSEDMYSRHARLE